MRTSSGRSISRQGFVLPGLIVLLTGAAVAAGLLWTERANREREAAWHREEETLATMVGAFRRQVAASGTIPGPDGWVAAVGAQSGLSTREIEFGRAPGGGFAGRRVLLVDPTLGSQSWPFRQSASAVLNASHAVLQSRSRMMWVSCTHPGLELPVTNGVATSEVFEALWNWAGGPMTTSPPSGWPAAWAGHGGHLHVARIPVSSLFAKVQLVNLKYLAQVGSVVGATANAIRPSKRRVTTYVLKGSVLKATRYDGNPYQVRVVTADDAMVINRLFSFGMDTSDLNDWFDRLWGRSSRYGWLMYLQATDIDNDEDWDLWSWYADFRNRSTGWGWSWWSWGGWGGWGGWFGSYWDWDGWLRNTRGHWTSASAAPDEDSDDDWVWDDHDCDDRDWDGWVSRARNRWGEGSTDDGSRWSWDGWDWNGWFRRVRRGRW